MLPRRIIPFLGVEKRQPCQRRWFRRVAARPVHEIVDDGRKTLGSRGYVKEHGVAVRSEETGERQCRLHRVRPLRPIKCEERSSGGFYENERHRYLLAGGGVGNLRCGTVAMEKVSPRTNSIENRPIHHGSVGDRNSGLWPANSGLCTLAGQLCVRGRDPQRRERERGGEIAAATRRQRDEEIAGARDCGGGYGGIVNGGRWGKLSNTYASRFVTSVLPFPHRMAESSVSVSVSAPYPLPVLLGPRSPPPRSLRFPMAAPERETKPEAVTPSPSSEPQPESESGVPAAAGRQELQPWEQHAAVINLPRYDYRASGSLLLRSHSGFLITCPIKREKSATKEAISILEEYIGHANCCVPEHEEPCDVENAVKKRKLCSETSENLEEAVKGGNNNDGSESTGNNGNSISPQFNTTENVDKASNLSLVKLSRSGLLFFKFPSGGLHVVEMLLEIFRSLSSGDLKCPQWCHRIFPIQETCVLSEKDLHATVSKLFLDFLRGRINQNDPIKFAVAYNRRGIDETEMKPEKNSNEGSNQQALMDREQCFKVVAASVKSVSENSVVDLKSPEVAVLVEMLPVSGVPLGSSVAGVSVLPAELISTKPRLCVRSLASDAKATKKK